MTRRSRTRRTRALLAPVVGIALVTAGCASGPTGSVPTPSATTCVAALPSQAIPDDGVTLGVNPDWGQEMLTEFTDATGLRPGAAVSFTDVPLDDADARNVRAAAEQVAGSGGVLVLTLEPRDGLGAVTDAVVSDVVDLLAEVNATGVPVLLRFAHEMNGSWYPWGQQPAAYVETFRRVAAAVHAGAPGTQTLWAPNYGGGGYPFVGGQHAAQPGTADLDLLDTNRDGALTGADDPYAPYYPGDDAVDWVGMSLYHWGDAYPWGEDEVPEPTKFLDQLTGTYVGASGDDSPVPDFHADYAQARGKPLAIPETAAFVSADADDALALQIKQTWWRQVFSDAVHERLPALRLVNWFDWDKHETEVDAEVRWSLSGDPAVAAAFRADLPAWVRQAPDVTPCRPTGASSAPTR
ncbi:glycoside hydrolase family 26 protein [Cellulomonas telluris]|uniref:glycoside hydrolase family 26 protein n=1 Tax=Cellulomonas telluris TaxID=2306636 RepID=UPI0010A94B9D|nr:glycosyl hydrolase [Cellulomonas telluris]